MWGIPMFGFRPRARYYGTSYYGGGYGGGYNDGYYGAPARRTGCGCLSTTTFFIIAVLLVVFMITGSYMRTMTLATINQ